LFYEVMGINFIEFTNGHLPLYFTWASKPHVKNQWFREGYTPPEAILDKLKGDSSAFPFIIMLDGKEIGFIQYYHLTENDKEIFGEEVESTVGFDIFIGAEDYIGKGYGTEVVRKFAEKLLAPAGVGRVITDPFTDNKGAIRCYEKAGFSFVKTAKDNCGTEIYIMEKVKGELLI